MGRWFWRWVCFLAGICLTAACGHSPSVRSETPTPTLLRFTPSAAQLPIGVMIRPFITATPLSTQPRLTLSGLTCYETPVQSLLCLGWAQNPLFVPHENLVLTLKLVADDGSIVASQTASLARDWLPADSGAPYRFIFEEIPHKNVTPHLGLLSANETHENKYLALEIRALEVSWNGNIYQISGEVHNKSPDAEVRIIITIRNAAGSVIGFRTLNQLENTFETNILPLEPYAETHTVTVTADVIKEY